MGTTFADIVKYGVLMTLYKGTKSEVTGIYYESNDYLSTTKLNVKEETIPSSFKALYVTPDKNLSPKEIHTSKDIPFILGVFLYRPNVNPEIVMTHHVANDSWKSIKGRFKYEVKQYDEVDPEILDKYGRREKDTYIIVSGFTGIGKSYFAEKYKDEYDILDLDSSYFSWVTKIDGTKEKQDSTYFAANYLGAIKELAPYVDIMFISTHDEIRRKLAEYKIPFISVYPKYEAKEQWLDRLRKRNHEDRIIPIMDENWDKFVKDIKKDAYGSTLVLLDGDKYLDMKWLSTIRNIMIGEPVVIENGIIM